MLDWAEKPKDISKSFDFTHESEADKIVLARLNCLNLRYMGDIPESVQLAAVESDVVALWIILTEGIKPSDAVQMAAICTDIIAVDYLNLHDIELSDAVKMALELRI